MKLSELLSFRFFFLVAFIFTAFHLAIAYSAANPQVIAISYSNGSTWINPDANVGVQNIACSDTYSRLKQVCDSFCSAPVKARFYSQKAYYDYTYSHFNMLNYPTFWQSYKPNVLMQNDLTLSKFYAERIEACKLCMGLGDVKPVWVVG